MGLRDQLELALEALLSVIGSSRATVPIAGIVLLLLVGLGFGWRRKLQHGSANDPATTDAELEDEAGADDLTPQLEDRILPLGRGGFLVLVLALAAGCWLTGFLLVKDKAVFFTSKEWQFQPFYIAAHLITLRLFVTLFTRNYRAGVARLNAPLEQALAGMHRILGPLGALCALAVAVPFCISDFRYLNSARYEKLVPGTPIEAIDYVMWSIWCAEWFLNAFIWVILIGFLVRNVRTLHDYHFTAPIEVVLQEKQYRPFLRMSSQGASVVLGFGIMTVLYISYTGGAVTDYLGLGITGLLLVVGFLVPWLLLRHKVRHAVVEEQARLQETLLVGPAGRSSGFDARSAEPYDLRSVAQRLDYVVSHLQIIHLERLHLRLGATEARAVAIRLLAPAATIAWQLSQNYKPVAEKLNGLLQPLLARLSGLSG